MYTKEQLQDAVICATRSIAKLYDSREELEKAVREFTTKDMLDSIQIKEEGILPLNITFPVCAFNCYSYE